VHQLVNKKNFDNIKMHDMYVKIDFINILYFNIDYKPCIQNEYYIFVNYFNVLGNIFFKEHLSEDGHNRWPKHAEGYAVYTTINLRICVCTCWS
jgi:hypothetical protein